MARSTLIHISLDLELEYGISYKCPDPVSEEFTLVQMTKSIYLIEISKLELLKFY